MGIAIRLMAGIATGLAIAYGMGSFEAYNLDPAMWPRGSRLLCIFLGIVFGGLIGCAWAATYGENTHKNLED